MARIFITGSADGLGHLTAKSLLSNGHSVVLHARNKSRAEEARKKLPDADKVLIGDLSDLDETKQLADQVNSLGRFDAIIHNAGVYQTTGKIILSVNTLAPYILTTLIKKPQRVIYLSSGMHLHGHANLDAFVNDPNQISYSDSKLHDVMLPLILSRKWPDVYANAVNPGWVPTKMGGKGAPDDLDKGYETQEWLAISDDEKAKVTGKYFFHRRENRYNPEAASTELQEAFIKKCAEITGVELL